MTPKNISVIVPCYNEKKRILPVILAISQSKYFPEIIVVDDGSAPASKKVLSGIKGIKLITHRHNLGKSQALKSGFLASRGDIVVFIDSDLIGLTPQHLDLLVEPILKHNYDLSIGDIERILFPFKLSGYSACYSGERAFKSWILKQHQEVFSPRGYVDGFLVEAEMNKIIFGRYKIAKVLLKKVSSYYKISKYGTFAFFDDLKIMSRCLSYLGLKEELRQLKFIRQLKYFI